RGRGERWACEIDLRGARAARRACAALCAAVGGRRAAADVDRLLVAIVCWWRTGDAAGAEDRRRAPATTGHRAAACDQHDTRRHTATSLMLMLLLRPPAAPRGSATGCPPKHGAEKSAVKGPSALTFMAPNPRARAREAEPSDALRQQTDLRSERPAGAACWPPSPIPF